VVVMVDTLGLATATAGAWAVARYSRTGAARWLALAGLAFAWATTTRWIYGLVALPFTAWALVVLRRKPVRTALLHAAGAAILASIVLAPTVVPAAVGLIKGGDASFAGDFQVYSWNPLNALHQTFTTADGQLAYGLPNGVYYALAPAFWYFLGPLLAAFVVPGIWAVVRSRSNRTLLILIAWAGIVFTFHAGAPWQNPRFALAYLPPVAILAALGFAELRQVAGTRIRWLVNAWLLAGLAFAATGSVVVTQEFIERKQHDVAIVRWTEHLAPANGQLLTFGLTATFQEYSRLQTLDLSEVGNSGLTRLLADGQPTLVLVDVASLERQWPGRAPWQRYRSLRDGPGLTTIGTNSGFTLLAVRDAAP
jgi:4-amino-4-deoxy-L-arabinose transferase-like glycosyltransferase